MKTHFKHEGEKRTVCGRPEGGTAKGSAYAAPAATIARHTDLTICEHCRPAAEAAIAKGVGPCDCWSCLNGFTK